MNVGAHGCDYSFARPDPAALAGAGYEFVMRYLAPPSDTGKVLTAGELAQLHDAGLAVGLVWEHAAADALAGAPLGTQMGAEAGQLARALGWPGYRPIYCGSFDFNVTPDQYPQCAAFLDAFIAASGFPGGPYGPRGYVDWALTNGHGTWGWQSAASYLEPYNQGTSQLAAICQQTVTPAVAGVDVDVALRPDVGAWDGSAPPPPPLPADAKEGTMLAECPTGGLWVAGADGGVFCYSVAGSPTAPYLGSLPGLGVKPAAPVVGIAATPSGRGYWLAGADGGVFCFGDAPFLGSLQTSGHVVTAPCVGIAAVKAGGYVLVFDTAGQVPTVVPFVAGPGPVASGRVAVMKPDVRAGGAVHAMVTLEGHLAPADT